MFTETDERLALARMLDRDADDDWRMIDELTERCRDKREKARKLREHVAQEAEIAALQRAADAELMRRTRRKVA